MNCDARVYQRLCSLLVASVLLAMASISFAATPNIIFVLCDDLGWTDTSVDAACLGNASDFYETPNLEALAESGMCFTAGYTCGANCAPTRAAIFSGQFASRETNNLFNVGSLNRTGRKRVPLKGPPQGQNGKIEIPGEAITIAESLKAAGYTTAHIGKYHVGDTKHQCGPLEQGFDFNYGGNHSGGPRGTYFADSKGEFSKNVSPELDEFASPGEHLTDAETDAAIDFLSKTLGQPVFLHLAYHAAHTPISGQGRKDLVAKYKEKQKGERHQDPDYAALVEGIDEGVGRIVEYLQQTDDPRHPGQKLAENTLIVFTSDNGGREIATENAPLRYQKGEYYEGGIRVPLIVSCPGLVPAGTTSSTPIYSVDFYTTFLSLADGKLPGDYALDGVDLTPVLKDPAAKLSRKALYWHFPGYLIGGGRDQRPQSVIRKTSDAHQWKLFYNYEDESWELYDLATDIGEGKNVAAVHPKVVHELGQQLHDWLQEVQAPLPTNATTGDTLSLPKVITNSAT